MRKRLLLTTIAMATMLFGSAITANAAAAESSAEAENSTETPSILGGSDEFPYELFTRYTTPDGLISYYYEYWAVYDTGHGEIASPQVYDACNNYNNLSFSGTTFTDSMIEKIDTANYLWSGPCQNMDAYIQTAAAWGLDARNRIATSWTVNGKQIYAWCP